MTHVAMANYNIYMCAQIHIKYTHGHTHTHTHTQTVSQTDTADTLSSLNTSV